MIRKGGKGKGLFGDQAERKIEKLLLRERLALNNSEWKGKKWK